jgi:putative ABC transport system permease protein
MITRWLEALLRLATDKSLADSILGDLEEGRRRQPGARRWVWYHRQLLAIIIRALADRVEHGFETSSFSPHIYGSRSDIRYAFRSLGSRPWYAGTVIGVIGLTLALATTVFAVVDGVLFKPLPYTRAAELYRVSGGYQRGQHSGIVVAPRNLRDWADAAADGALMAAYWEEGPTERLGSIQSWSPKVAAIDARLLDVLGVQPLLGGFLNSDFDDEQQPQPAIIGYGLWQSAFGGRVDVLGQTLAVDNLRRFRVAGVLLRDFVFPSRSAGLTNVLVPLVIPKDRANDLKYRRVYGLARLPAATGFDIYQQRMDAAAQAETTEWAPDPHEGTPAFDHAGLEPLETVLTTSQRPMFLTIFGAALALVLLGCVNVSGLMASRAEERWRELATRRALGATSSHLARLTVSESLLASSAGVIFGLCLAKPMLSTTLRLLPSSTGLLKAPGLDGRVLGFAIGASVLVALAASIWPVRRTSSLQALPVHSLAQSFVSPSTRGPLVVVAAQIALGFVLALGGILLVGSLVRVWQTDPGFAADHLLVAEGTIQKSALGERRDAALLAVRHEIERMPGVESVGATASPILRGGVMMNAFKEGATYAIDDGFFRAAGLSMLTGRWLSQDEIKRGTPVVVVSETFAKRLTSNGDVVGRTITGYAHQTPTIFTIIGTVKDARFSKWDMAGLGQAYAPYLLAADDQPRVSLLIRTQSNSAAPAAALIRYATVSEGPVRISAVMTAADLLGDSVRGRQLTAWIFGGFAFAALVIMGTGVLGLLAMSTAQRVREVGIRLALGATRHRIVGGLLMEQLMSVLIGVAAGGILAFWTVGFVKSYLYEATAFDSRLWAEACALVMVTALMSALVPCWRATGVDPIQTLKAE